MDVVIGLIGAKGSGKTTAYEVIRKEIEVQEITLASKLKDVAAKATGIPRNKFDSHEFKEADLDSPIFLTQEILEAIWRGYDLNPKEPEFFDKYVRSHIGKVLHTPRQVAQYVGTEILRSYEPDIHCIEACKAITKDVGVVTDLRFPNEYSFFKRSYQKFFSIHIHNMAAEIQASKDPHPSEAHIKDLSKRASVTISNNSSIKEFQDSIRKYIREVINA